MESETSAVGAAGVWDRYFGEPAPPEGGVNWDAYSHEELYQMLWQDADVADVSTIAAEWSEHRAALGNHADVLREQRAALAESWQGTGAEEAARRLAVLADRVEKIAELAFAGQQAAEHAADALARARAMMPAPPGEAAAPMTDPVTNWMSMTTAPAPSTAESQPATNPITRWMPSTTTTADPATTFGAVGGAGFSFYAGADTAETQKQQAIRAMRTYESSLTDSSQLIGQARGTIPPATTLPSSSTATTAAATTATSPSHAPSGQPLAGTAPMVGSAPTPPPASGAAVGALVGGAGTAAGLGQGHAAWPGAAGSPLGPGARVGAMPFPGSGATAAQLASESAAARPGVLGGMVPPGAARGGPDEEQHENHLPTIDHGLFTVEEPGSEAVIGLSPEGQR
ncbi:hypothetical protein [Saccharomonospora piscinae]|uniref:hypothetical protein n=1 Tax=Saccharomonospora piscinae TaxID=687388 RepID=UPI0004671474|nr:hypothetical protein [Saccharomonospora piscinae]